VNVRLEGVQRMRDGTDEASNPTARAYGRRDFLVGAGAAVLSALGGCASARSAGPATVKAGSPRLVRRLGKLEVPGLGFGCMNLTGTYGPRLERTRALMLTDRPECDP
jgi:hypothetical protein